MRNSAVAAAHRAADVQQSDAGDDCAAEFHRRAILIVLIRRFDLDDLDVSWIRAKDCRRSGEKLCKLSSGNRAWHSETLYGLV